MITLLFAGLTGCGPAVPAVDVVHLREDLVEWGGSRAEVADGSGRPRTEILAPSPELAVQKESLPAWVVPPGSSVTFALDLDPPVGTLVLNGFLGADASAWVRLAEHPGSSVELTLSVDGEPAAATRLTSASSPEWIALGSATPSSADLEVEADSLIELACTATGPLADLDLAVGFARLVVQERRRLGRSPATPNAPNVVLFVMDTLRGDRTSAYGYERRTTPHLERLASRGSTFEVCYSTAPWTWPSTASILTGKSPELHGVTDSRNSYLASSLETLPESALEAGLLTGAFVGNPLIVPQRNFDQGFHRFRGTRAAELLDTDLLVPEAIDWVDRVSSGRFFLYVQAMDPHEPHDWIPATEGLFPGKKPRGYPATGMVGVRTSLLRKRPTFQEDGTSRLASDMPEGWIEYARATYDRAVRTGDERFGDLVDHLEAEGLLGRTVVAFTSDHGEEFLEHGGLLHGHQLFEESVRVPLVLAGPGVPAGARFENPVSNSGLPATLARLAGFPFDASPAAPDLFEAAADPNSNILFSNQNGIWSHEGDVRQIGLRRGHRKVVLGVPASPDAALWQGADLERTFDLSVDPGEREDRPDPDAKALLEQLREYDSWALDQRPEALSGAGEDTRAMLRVLGYLDEE